jgi:hypothetical protein
VESRLGVVAVSVGVVFYRRRNGELVEVLSNILKTVVVCSANGRATCGTSTVKMYFSVSAPYVYIIKEHIRG